VLSRVLAHSRPPKNSGSMPCVWPEQRALPRLFFYSTFLRPRYFAPADNIHPPIEIIRAWPTPG